MSITVAISTGEFMTHSELAAFFDFDDEDLDHEDIETCDGFWRWDGVEAWEFFEYGEEPE